MTNPPTEADFRSPATLGQALRPPQTRARQHLWEGLSVYDDEDQAAWRAVRMNPPRPWLAALAIVSDGPVILEKTMQDAHHFTVWGTPEQCLERVVSVLAVTGSRRASRRCAMAVELWEEQTGNAIDDFATEADALSYVREVIQTRGELVVASWAMDVDRKQPMLRGRELVERALAVPA